ncbi:hypothetical protein [Accumulibacter sp.]|uniref:hypothetical protein n=1 Tax=Accumulibacter sp. TaxID=2053492 RepID=UPI0028C455C7|nr:hypothetical protein [Accumulibacter sp.]
MPPLIATILSSLDKGWATLVAAAVAALVSLLSLLVSILSARAQTRLSSRLTDTTNVSKEARDYKLRQLTSFYDPVYTLLAANKAIFERIGPTSAARTEQMFNDEETADVWQTLSNEVVVPNNQRVCEIIHAQLHFLAENDDESLYLEFLTHAQAYKVFKQGTYEAYRLFPYPKEILAAVKKARSDLRASLADVYRHRN